MRGRGYSVEREILLQAYERVTPPRTAEDRAHREQLVSLARRIAYPASKSIAIRESP